MTSDSSKTDKKTPRANRNPRSDLGDALRAVYRETVAEDVPDEMLDLLRKLG